MSNRTHVLITGGTGYLGSRLVLMCLEKGYRVSVLLRASSYFDLKGKTPVCIYQLEANKDVASILIQCYPDVVIHAACCYGRHGESVEDVYNANYAFGVDLLSMFKEGDKQCTFFNCHTSLPYNVSLYAKLKHEFAEYGLNYIGHSRENLKFVNVELEHIYGPHDSCLKFVTYVLRACVNNQKKLELTLGEQIRDFIYIEDVLSAFDVLIEKRNVTFFPDKIGLGFGRGESIRSIVELIHQRTVSKTQLCFGAVPYREYELMKSMADISFLKTLGWSPRFSIQEGIEDLLLKEICL